MTEQLGHQQQVVRGLPRGGSIPMAQAVRGPSVTEQARQSVAYVAFLDVPAEPAGISIHAPRMGSDRENGHLRPRYGQNHPFSTLIVSQIVVDVLGTVRKSQKHQRTSHYEVIKQPERQK